MFDSYNGVREETQEITILIFKLKKFFNRRKLVLKNLNGFSTEVTLIGSTESYIRPIFSHRKWRSIRPSNDRGRREQQLTQPGYKLEIRQYRGGSLSLDCYKELYVGQR